MAHHHTLRLACHATALLMEAVGSLFIWLDTVRLNAMVGILGYASFNGEPAKFKAWYYHSFGLGFGLLFAGMILAAFVLWIEHVAHVRSLRGLSAGGLPALLWVPEKEESRPAPRKDDYPQDISPEEAELKFERLLIDGIGALMGSQINPTPVPVVARVLSPSDVLIKIHDLKGRVRYSLRRWGYSKTLDDPNRCQWNALDITGGVDPNQSIVDYSFAVHEEKLPAEIVAVPFSYRKA